MSTSEESQKQPGHSNASWPKANSKLGPRKGCHLSDENAQTGSERCDTSRPRGWRRRRSSILSENYLLSKFVKLDGDQDDRLGEFLTKRNRATSVRLVRGETLSRIGIAASWNVLISLLLALSVLQEISCLVININVGPRPSANSGAAKFQTGNSEDSFRAQFAANETGGGPESSKHDPPSRLAARSGRLSQEVDALGYLQRYGYMNGTAGNANLISEDSFHEAVMSFQRFAGIPETGSVDSLTVRYMQMPRCGNKDRSGKGENGKRRRRRRKRYALQGSKWRRQELTYRISQYPTRFLNRKHEVDAQIEKAFKLWSQVSPIEFVAKREGRVHIDIRFASGEHGDGDPFDGPGNTLAHAYFPQYGGDAHFDDQEYWTVDSYAGTNIFQVAAHELGHSLGLGHSSVREALMAPFYQKYKPNFKLHADDVLAIQALYGERGVSDEDSSSSTSSTSIPSSTTTSTESPRRRADPSDGGFFGFGSSGGSKPVDLCQDATIDAVTRTEDGNTYVFRGQHYWLVKNEGIASGYPARISRDWDGLPGNLDAALTWSDGKTFFFKGDKYWRFYNKRREPGYPKLISAGFAGIPNNVDAAFVWGGNGKTYFFKGDKYWRFDSKQEPPVSAQYPKSLRNWVGLPTSGVDGAFKWDNGMTYFFKGDQYYRFDDRQFEVDTSARPSFPRPTGEWWFGCPNNNNLAIVAKPTGSGGGTDDDSLGDLSSSSSSILTYHRRPQLSLDESSSNRGSEASEDEDRKPSGNSLSRSIIASISALLSPSSSSSSTSGASSSGSSDRSARDSKIQASPKSDWSFHHGVGEEVRRTLRSQPPQHHLLTPLSSTSLFATSRGSSGGSTSDTSRWLFPISSTSVGGSQSREQSLSELRMAPDDQTGSNGRPLELLAASQPISLSPPFGLDVRSQRQMNSTQNS